MHWRKNEGQTWKGDLLLENWGADLIGVREVQPTGQKRKFAGLPSLGLVLASKKQGSGLQASLQRKTKHQCRRKPLAANAGRSPSGH